MSSGSSAWEGQLTSLILSEYASTEMSIHALYMHEVIVCEHVESICMNYKLNKAQRIILNISFILLYIYIPLQLHKQQSRCELSRHTWHRQESDESSDSVPDEVRSEPTPHSRNFPRSHTFPTTVPSPSAIPTSASAISSTNLGQEGASSQNSTQRRLSGPSTGACLFFFYDIASPYAFEWNLFFFKS